MRIAVLKENTSILTKIIFCQDEFLSYYELIYLNRHNDIWGKLKTKTCKATTTDW